MFRLGSRVARPLATRPIAATAAATAARRAVHTSSPVSKSRSWKSLFARIGAVGGAIYYYNTWDLLGEEPRYVLEPELAPETLPTLEMLEAERAERRAIAAELEKRKREEEKERGGPESGAAGAEALEAEADQQGAFNPETGEINWDCPCLGGMAHGPCGEEFKTAFSCFVYSTDEPKGMDCVDNFKNMQNCFRQYPEIYGSEIDRDDNIDADDDDNNSEIDKDLAGSAPITNARAVEGDDQDEDSDRDLAVSAPAVPDDKPASAPLSTDPHAAEKVKENKRELGLVPESYRADADDKES